MRQTTRVTLVQTSGDGRSASDDLDHLLDEVRAHRGSDLVIFPEFALRKTVDYAEAARLLGSQGPAVVYGELREDDGFVRNLATYADRSGSRSYAKTHVHWTEGFAAGSEFPVIETPLGPTGMLICFDAAFAEVPAALAVNGAKAILNLSAIPSHFPLKIVHRRLVAASVFNQVFSFFANRTGDGYLGGSAIVDPQGEMLAVAGERERSFTIDIDMSEVDRWRAAEPMRAFRRPQIYGDLTKVAPVPTTSSAEPELVASTHATSPAASY